MRMRARPAGAQRPHPGVQCQRKVLSEIRKDSRRSSKTTDRNTLGSLPAETPAQVRKDARHRGTMESDSTGISTPENEPHSLKETQRDPSKSSAVAEVPDRKPTKEMTRDPPKSLGAAELQERRLTKETPGHPSKSAAATRLDSPDRKFTKETPRNPSKSSVARDSPDHRGPTKETPSAPSKSSGAAEQPESKLTKELLADASRTSLTQDMTRVTSTRLISKEITKEDALGLDKVFGLGVEDGEEEDEEEESEAEEEAEHRIMLYRPKEVEQIKVRAQDFLQHKGDIKTLRKCQVLPGEGDAGDTGEAANTKRRPSGRPTRRATIGGGSGFHYLVRPNAGSEGVSRSRTMSKEMSLYATSGPSSTPRAGTKSRPDQLRSAIAAYREEAPSTAPANDQDAEQTAPKKKTRAIWQQAARSAISARG